MSFQMAPGIYPAMITPFTDDNQLDLEAAARLVAYYDRSGCDGIFAVCQSSEMFFLTENEKTRLMRAVAQASGGRMRLVASGHTSDQTGMQIRQLAAMAEAGADVAVMVLNRLAAPDESEDVVKRHIEEILNALPGIEFGLYECPYPYKRLASTELTRWIARTGRFTFMKDTCCRIERLMEKRETTEGTPLRLFNANTATLLESLRAGIDGYCGVMANFHADLYVKLARHYTESAAVSLQQFLTLAALIERQLYPVNAKYRMRLEGIPMSLKTRSAEDSQWNSTLAAEVEALYALEQDWRAVPAKE